MARRLQRFRPLTQDFQVARIREEAVAALSCCFLGDAEANQVVQSNEQALSGDIKKPQNDQQGGKSATGKS